ncbi:hypothetical protein [Paenibacillus wynnii]|uniref:Uncharacterized protein n=1 Tax=Paenibacillus wynnii TaxID=268407 RepID=A0A098M786_9BACL|nr:hypothetical protein [Paenibacillus wynnii]KGE17908.1 hypothetical protein PWYN_25510 [Paenibacillus wynnii]
MKKVLTRIAFGLLIINIAAIILCFYMNKFTYAYGLMMVPLIIFTGMGQISKLKNDEYMFEKLKKRDIY